MSDPSPTEPQTGVSLRSVSLVTIFSVGQLLVLFVLQLVLAKYFGASQELDVYMAVQAIPLVLGAVLSGSLSSVLIPLASELRQSHSGEVVQTMLNRLGWILLAGSVTVALGVFLIAGPVTQLLYGDFLPVQIELGAEMLRILIWLIPLNTMISYFFSLYHDRQHFLLPAVSGLVGPIITVALVSLYPEGGVRQIAWATVIGGIVGVSLLAPGFPRARALEPVPLKAALKRFSVLLWPLLLGAAYFRLDPILDRHLAAGLSAGSISHLGYSWRIVSSVAVLATSGLSGVAFPALARHAAARDETLFAAEIAHAWRFLCVVLIPCVGGLLLYSETLIAWLLQRGEFTPADTQAVGWLICLYSLTIFTAGIGEVAARSFYARGITRAPTLIIMIGFTFGAIAKFALTDRFGAAGLAFLTSAYHLLNIVMFLVLLRWWVAGQLFAGLGSCLARTLLCTALSLGAAWPVLHQATGWQVPIGIGIAVGVYLLLQGLFKDEFLIRILQGTRRIIGRNPSTSETHSP